MSRLITDARVSDGAGHPFPLSELKAVDRAVVIPGEPQDVSGQAPIWGRMAWLPAQSTAAFANGPAVVSVTLEVRQGGLRVEAIARDGGLIDSVLVDDLCGRKTCELFLDDAADCAGLSFASTVEEGPPVRFQIHAVDATVLSARRAVQDQRTLYAFYDLNRMPATFDFVFYLWSAELTRCEKGLDHIQVVFIPADHQWAYWTPPDARGFIDAAARDWRQDNILIPTLRLFPTVSGYAVAGSRAQGEAWRRNVESAYPPPLPPDVVPAHAPYQHVHAAQRHETRNVRPRAPQQGLRFVEQWVAAHGGGRKLVVITLRQYGLHSERNSNLAEWAAFAKGLDRNAFLPVFIPDTAVALQPPPAELDGLPMVPEAAFNLGLRMAFYESAHLNLVTSGGPFNLLYASDRCRYIAFRIVVADSPFCTVERLASELGVLPGRELSDPARFQKIVWEDDRLDTVRREFEAMCARIVDRGE